MSQSTEKARVYALAKQLNTDSKVILDICRELGYDVKNQLSSLESDQCTVIQQRFGKPSAKSAAVAPTESVPVPKPAAAPAPVRPVAEKRMVNLTAPRSAKAPAATPTSGEDVAVEVVAAVAPPVEAPAPAVREHVSPPVLVDLPPAIESPAPAIKAVESSVEIAPAPVSAVESKPEPKVELKPEPAKSAIPSPFVRPKPLGAIQNLPAGPRVALKPLTRSADAPPPARRPESTRPTPAAKKEADPAKVDVPVAPVLEAKVAEIAPLETAEVEVAPIVPAAPIAAAPAVVAPTPAVAEPAPAPVRAGLTNPFKAAAPKKLLDLNSLRRPASRPLEPTPISATLMPTAPVPMAPEVVESNGVGEAADAVETTAPVAQTGGMPTMAAPLQRPLTPGAPRSLTGMGRPGQNPNQILSTPRPLGAGAARPLAGPAAPAAGTSPLGARPAMPRAPLAAAPLAGANTTAPLAGANPGNPASATGPGGVRPDRRFDRDRRNSQSSPSLRPGQMAPAGPGGPGGPLQGPGMNRSPMGNAGGPGGPGTMNRGPGGPGTMNRGPGGAPPGPPPAPRRFTPEELEALRSGRSVTDVLKKSATPAATPMPLTPMTEDDDRRAGPGGAAKKPGEVTGRDDRHKARAERAEKRKVRGDSIIVEGGRVEMIENPWGTRHGKRPKASMMRRKPTEERKGKIPISLPITVRSLSEAIGMKAAAMLFKLKELTNSLFTINSGIDLEVAELIAEEKGCELEVSRPRDEEEVLMEASKALDDPSKLEPRAPVVTIMGHVDHGKTSLLDRIRKSNIVDTEAGGITQVIRAWRVEHEGKYVTFLDTPGHEAFTKMRARGANVTDIAVIVVAADSGVKPQTQEAVAHAKAAGVRIVVAINKIDMPNADIKKTESQLYALELIPDNMGGEVPFVYTSAATGQGIDELLEKLSIEAEFMELKANPHKPAIGTCLEAYLSGDEGVMATLLVQQGTLRKGDVIVCGAAYGRVRAMYDDLGRPLKEAGPSVPVRVTGLNEVPRADDHFHVMDDLSKAREISETRQDRELSNAQHVRQAVSLESLGKTLTKVAELKVILKAEARGSIEAILKELEKLVHDEVRVRVLYSAIGAITESDVDLALASPEDSIVVGFNVVPDEDAIRLASERGISIREYNIIYNLTDDIRSALEGKLKPREDVIHLGRALIREVFKISRVGSIAGCYVTSGTIERSAKVRVIRDGVVVFPPADRVASLESLKRFKEDAKEVREGFDCGMKVAGYDDVKSGDVIEAYRIEMVQRKL